MANQTPRYFPPTQRVGKALRHRAKYAVRGITPPTVAIGVPGGDDVSQRHARSVIDLALRIGEALLSTGASASDVVATVLRLTDAYEIRSAHVDITFTSITVSIHRGIDEDPLSVMRVVKVRSADYTRLQNVHALVRDVAERGLDLEAARARLTAILHAPHPYRRWVVTASLGVMGAAIVGLFGGGVVMMLLAAVTIGVVDRVQRRLARKGIAAFFTQAVGAAIPTVVAVVLYYAQSRGVEIPTVLSPSLVVVSGIILLLAGLSVVGAAQDAIDGYYVTAGARGAEVLILTLGIAVGIATVLGLAHRLGVQMDISASVLLSTDPVKTTISAVVAAGAFAVSTYTGVRAIWVCMGTAGLGWMLYGVGGVLELDPASRSAVAAIGIGALAQFLARRLQVPALAATTAGIIPLLPGLTVYRGLFQLLEGSPATVPTGLNELLTAAAIGLGLAAGVSAGTFLARARPGELDRAQRRALRRSAADARE